MRLRLALAALAASTPLAGQGPGFQVGHLFTDPPATTYRLGSSAALLGPLGAGVHLTVVDGSGRIGNLWGGGVELNLFRSGSAGPYLMGAVEGGFGTRGKQSFWGSWSTGLGYEVFPVRGVAFVAEGRYRVINGRYDGVELGLRLALNRQGRASGGGGRAAPPAARSLSTPDASAPEAADVRAELDRAGVPEESSRRISQVVQTALDVMGMPYRWGDAGDEGFDCSGLIQYAFSRHGVALPRRSVDQAREGREVPRELGSLRAGDILTFANSGTRITHVGLYVGGGRFIHSASSGVQISLLSPDDASGRWWYRRWAGARRIID